jgi:hypothetical protein
MLLSVSWSVSCGTMSPWSRFHFARGGGEKEQGQNRQRTPQQCHVIYLLEITAGGGVYAFVGKRFSIFFVLMSLSASPEHRHYIYANGIATPIMCQTDGQIR